MNVKKVTHETLTKSNGTYSFNSLAMRSDEWVQKRLELLRVWNHRPRSTCSIHTNHDSHSVQLGSHWTCYLRYEWDKCVCEVVQSLISFFIYTECLGRSRIIQYNSSYSSYSEKCYEEKTLFLLFQTFLLFLCNKNKKAYNIKQNQINIQFINKLNKDLKNERKTV